MTHNNIDFGKDVKTTIVIDISLHSLSNLKNQPRIHKGYVNKFFMRWYQLHAHKRYIWVFGNIFCASEIIQLNLNPELNFHRILDTMLYNLTM